MIKTCITNCRRSGVEQKMSSRRTEQHRTHKIKSAMWNPIYCFQLCRNDRWHFVIFSPFFLSHVSQKIGLLFFSLFINFFWLVSSLISALALRLSYKDACIFNVIAYTGFEYLARTGCYVNLMNSMRELFTEGTVAVAVATIQLPGLVFSTNWIFCASWNGINCLARDTHTHIQRLCFLWSMNVN